MKKNASCYHTNEKEDNYLINFFNKLFYIMEQVYVYFDSIIEPENKQITIYESKKDYPLIFKDLFFRSILKLANHKSTVIIAMIYIDRIINKLRITISIKTRQKIF